MKFIYFLALLPLSFSSCNLDQNSDSTATDTTMAEQDLSSSKPDSARQQTTALLEKGCYTYRQNGDLVELKIVNLGDTISGPLSYALFEKDKNSGTFSGILKDDLLIGTYNFMSEGVRSSREMVFKVSGTSLIEGFGEVNTVGNQVKFKNIRDLNFNSTVKLEKENCDL